SLLWWCPGGDCIRQLGEHGHESHGGYAGQNQFHALSGPQRSAVEFQQSVDRPSSLPESIPRDCSRRAGIRRDVLRAISEEIYALRNEQLAVQQDGAGRQ